MNKPEPSFRILKGEQDVVGGTVARSSAILADVQPEKSLDTLNVGESTPATISNKSDTFTIRRER